VALKEKSAKIDARLEELNKEHDGIFSKLDELMSNLKTG
jgi:hypothetical protein